MGIEDRSPAGRYRKKIDPKRAQQIREGGKKAEAIRQKAMAQHKELEEPLAEKILEEELKKLNKKL